MGAVIIIPMNHHVPSPFILQSRDKKPRLRSFDLIPGRIYQFDTEDVNISAAIVFRIRKYLILDTAKNVPVIFYIDSLQRWSVSFEDQIRQMIKEAPMGSFALWLHSPLQLIPEDMISSIDNFVVAQAAKNDIDILAKYLPHKIPEEYLVKGIENGFLIYSRLGEERPSGWDFVELSA